MATRQFSTTHLACILFLLDGAGLATSGHSWSRLCLLSLPWQGLLPFRPEGNEEPAQSHFSQQLFLFPRAPGTHFCQSTSYTDADLPCLLDSELLKACQIISVSPGRKHWALLWGGPSAVLSREELHTTLALHPSLHSEPDTPLVSQALPAQV